MGNLCLNGEHSGFHNGGGGGGGVAWDSPLQNFQSRYFQSRVGSLILYIIIPQRQPLKYLNFLGENAPQTPLYKILWGIFPPPAKDLA